MQEKTNGLTKERRQIISLFLVGFSLYFYLFVFWSQAQSSLPCWRCLILTSDHLDPGNRVGQCCVYGFVTSGFRKMKLLVQTAAPLTAPVKSQGMLQCLNVNHFLQWQTGKGKWYPLILVSAPGLPPSNPGPAQDASLALLNLNFQGVKTCRK
jgi:hypothetical protein